MPRPGIALGSAMALLLLWLAACRDHTPPVPPPSASLSIHYEQQQAGLWCWAASAVMIVKTLGHQAEQCDAAEAQLAVQDCCPGGKPSSSCDKTGWPPFKKLGFDFSETTDLALTIQQLMNEIGIARRPVAVSWEYTDSMGNRLDQGHMLVAGGYMKLGGLDHIELYDPLCSEDVPADPSHPCGYRIVPYSEYVAGEMANGTEYVHWDDFYEIRMP